MLSVVPAIACILSLHLPCGWHGGLESYTGVQGEITIGSRMMRSARDEHHLMVVCLLFG